MQLSPEQTARFYQIWFALLSDINTHLALVSSFPAMYGETEVSTDDVRQLRDALWVHDELREQFIATNPAQLGADDLALVASWRYRVQDTFIIYRALRKYTIFLSQTSPAHAYGVVGLVSPIAETVPLPLPVYCEAVLLPYEEYIIYDSLLITYNVVLGTGIRQDLQETYRNLQEREGIISSLLPQERGTRSNESLSRIMARNQKVLTAFRRELGKSGLSPQMVETHTQTIADFAQSVLLAHTPPQGVLDCTFADIQFYLATHEGKTLVTSFKRFIRFLRDTGRIEYEFGEEVAADLRRLGKQE